MRDVGDKINGGAVSDERSPEKEAILEQRDETKIQGAKENIRFEE